MDSTNMDCTEDFEERSSNSAHSYSGRGKQEVVSKSGPFDEQDSINALVEKPLFLPSNEEDIVGSSKRKISRQLFSDKAKAPKLEGANSTEQALVPSQKPPLTKLLISEIGPISSRFAFEGKILNIYGTYDSKRDYKKYLKCDLTDEVGFGTISLVIGSEQIKNFEGKIKVNTFIRIEGAIVVARSPSDGGSIDYSLHVDARTTIGKGEPFDACLIFVPELTIQKFLGKLALNSSLKSTIAFVIIQVDKVEKSEGGVFEQLTIADGPSALDRATLTFVNKRKADYHKLVDEFHRGNIIPYVARNVGSWKGKSNTLSILDITLLAPLYGNKRKKELEHAFHVQISDMGYGKEIFGEFRITNFNGAILLKKCKVCKGFNVNACAEEGFCFSCGESVDVEEVVKLSGEILHSGICTEVTLVGDAVDKVLLLEDSILSMYKKDGIMTRFALSEIAIEGFFLIDNQGQIIGFRSNITT